MRRLSFTALALTLAGAVGVAAAAQSPPVPQPFPGSSGAPSTPRPAAPAAPPATAPAPARPPAAAPVTSSRASGPDIGVQVYPTADFLSAVDAGSGQRYYLWGSNAAYADVVAYYKTVLKNGGRELYDKTPPMQQFDLGDFKKETMAYPPSVVVKDYTWNGSSGYLFISGTTEKRYRTVIQIVPPPPSR